MGAAATSATMSRSETTLGFDHRSSRPLSAAKMRLSANRSISGSTLNKQQQSTSRSRQPWLAVADDYDDDDEAGNDDIVGPSARRFHYNTFSSSEVNVVMAAAQQQQPATRRLKLQNKLLKMIGAERRKVAGNNSSPFKKPSTPNDDEDYRSIATKSLVLSHDFNSNSESIKSGTGTVNRVGNSSTKSTTASLGTNNKSGNGLSHQISHSSTSSGCSSASSSTSSSAAVRRSRRQDLKMLFIMQQQQQQQSTQNHTQVDPQMLLSGSSANILTNHRSPNILSSSSSNSILSSSKSKIDSSNNVQTSSFTPNNNNAPTTTTTYRNSSYINGLNNSHAQQQHQTVAIHQYQRETSSVGGEDDQNLVTATTTSVASKVASSSSMLNRFLKSATISAKMASADLDTTSYLEDDDEHDNDNEESAEEPKTKKNNKKNKNKLRKRDSGIISDIFHLGSMNNLIKSKLSSASHTIRNSLSVFSLKQQQRQVAANSTTTATTADSDELPNNSAVHRSFSHRLPVSAARLISRSQSKLLAATLSSASSNQSPHHSSSIYASKSNIFTSFDETNEIDEVNKEQQQNQLRNRLSSPLIGAETSLKSTSSSISALNNNITNVNIESVNRPISSAMLKRPNSSKQPPTSMKWLEEPTTTSSSSYSTSSSFDSSSSSSTSSSSSSSSNYGKQTAASAGNVGLRRTTTFHACPVTTTASYSRSILPPFRIPEAIAHQENVPPSNASQARFKSFQLQQQPAQQLLTINCVNKTVLNGCSTNVCNLPAINPDNKTANPTLNSTSKISIPTTTTTNTLTKPTSLLINSTAAPKSQTVTTTTTSKYETTQTPAQQQTGHKHQKIVVQASTNDLLRCLVNYLGKHCSHLIIQSTTTTKQTPTTIYNQYHSHQSNQSSPGEVRKTASSGKVEPRDIICWLRSADRTLLTQGWQEIAFMNPVNVVFVYLLVKEGLRLSEIASVHELHCQLMTCLYLAFSYMGNEISYPLKPFLVEHDRQVFWQRVCDLMSRLSSCMLRINQEPRYFTELFYELKSHANIVSIVQSATVSAASDQTSTPTIPKSITINAFSNHHNSNANTNTNNVLSAYNQSSINSLSREKFYKQQQQQQQPLMMTQNLVSTFSSTVQPRCCYNSQFCDHHGGQHHVMSHQNHHQRHRASDLGPKPIAAYCI